jgi:hypothetical protein
MTGSGGREDVVPPAVRSVVRAAAKRAAAKRPPKPPPGPAAVDPVAEVVVDVALAHLDRPFEYLVPEPMAAAAVPGARVRVRFAGQDLDGYVIARKASADHAGRLAPLRRVVSAEPVLSPTCSGCAGRSPSTMPGRCRTCCGWRCRHGTPTLSARPAFLRLRLRPARGGAVRRVRRGRGVPRPAAYGRGAPRWLGRPACWR